MERKTLLPPLLMLILAPVLWSSANVVGKLMVPYYTPNQLTFYRWVLASLILGILFKENIKRDLALIKSRWIWLFIWGSAGFALHNICLYNALSHGVSVFNVGIIFALMPCLVLLANYFIYKEKVHFLQWGGVILGLLGVLWLVSGGDLIHFKFRSNLAELWVVAMTLIYASYSIALRYAPQIHWTSLMWSMCLAAVITTAPFYIYDFTQTHSVIGKISTATDLFKALSGWIYLSIFASIFSKMFYMEGVIAVGAARASIVMDLLPIFNAIAPLLVFSDERAAFSSVHLIAFILVCLGIFSSEIGAKLKRAISS